MGNLVSYNTYLCIHIEACTYVYLKVDFEKKDLHMT